MVYDDPTNLTRTHHLFSYVNTATNGLFGFFLVVTIFVTCFISVKRKYGSSTKDAFATSIFLTFIFSIFLNILSLVGAGTIFILIIGVGVGVVWLLRGD